MTKKENPQAPADRVLQNFSAENPGEAFDNLSPGELQEAVADLLTVAANPAEEGEEFEKIPEIPPALLRQAILNFATGAAELVKDVADEDLADAAQEAIEAFQAGEAERILAEAAEDPELAEFLKGLEEGGNAEGALKILSNETGAVNLSVRILLILIMLFVFANCAGTKITKLHPIPNLTGTSFTAVPLGARTIDASGETATAEKMNFSFKEKGIFGGCAAEKINHPPITFLGQTIKKGSSENAVYCKNPNGTIDRYENISQELFNPKVGLSFAEIEKAVPPLGEALQKKLSPVKSPAALPPLSSSPPHHPDFSIAENPHAGRYRFLPNTEFYWNPNQSLPFEDLTNGSASNYSNPGGGWEFHEGFEVLSGSGRWYEDKSYFPARVHAVNPAKEQAALNAIATNEELLRSARTLRGVEAGAKKTAIRQARQKLRKAKAALKKAKGTFKIWVPFD